MLPKTIEETAKAYECEKAQVLAELRQLGVPVHQFLGKTVFYADDLRKAHQQQLPAAAKQTPLDRILGWFEDNGCQVERTSLKDSRARGIYKVTSNRDGTEPVFVKIQVCKTLQRGNWVHFNLTLDVLVHPAVEWFVLVAPVFSPGHTDFAGSRGRILQQARTAGYRDKQSYPFRVKETSSESYLQSLTQEMMEKIHGSYSAWQAAKQETPMPP